MFRQFEFELEKTIAPRASIARRSIGESNWHAFFRLLGTITASSIGPAILLHQLHCELSNTATHWLSATLLASVAAISCATLLPSKILGLRLSTFLNGGCAISLALVISLLELCDEHFAFCLVLFGINAGALFISMSSVFGNGKSSFRGNANEMDMDSESNTAEDGLASGHEAESDLKGNDSSSESRQLKPIWMRHPAWVLFGIGFIVYMIIVPTIGMVIDWFTPAKSGKVTDMTLLEAIRLRTVSGVVTVMFLGMGASVGSFLNVVIYRLPRSLPLLWPPSACAKCGTRLSGKDNIPVIAWLKLGGRCRYCRVPISARYPVIEALVGLVFVVFFFRELLSGGVNLPGRTPNFYHGIVWILFYTKWDLVTLYLFHMSLLVLLLSWAMINLDQFRVPMLYVVLSLSVFAGLASAFPHLNPTHWSWTDTVGSVPASLIASLVGCLTGLVVGWAMNRLLCLRKEPLGSIAEVKLEPDADTESTEDLQTDVADTDDPSDSISDHDPSESASLYGSISSEPKSSADMAACLALVGAALGFEAALVVALLTALLVILSWFFRAVLPNVMRGVRPLPSTLFVFVSATLFLFFWVSIHSQVLELFERFT